MNDNSQSSPDSDDTLALARNEESEAPQEYWAFISYRHADNQQQGRRWATWLQNKLETYDIPEEFVGNINERNESVPHRLYPVFRDEEELSADSDLSNAIKSALDRSKFLIVVCSPNAVGSPYVTEEILYFKRLGRSDRIFAVIINGEPNISWDEDKQRSLLLSPFQECFPEPIMYHLTDGGELDLNNRAEPIAADFRLPGPQQGWTNTADYRAHLETQGTHKAEAIRQLASEYETKLQLGLDKTIAGVLGLPLRLVSQRGKTWELQKERRKAKILAAWLSLSAALAVIAIAGGLFGWLQYREASKNQQMAEASKKQALKNLKQAEANQKRAETNQKRAEASEAEARELISFVTFRLVQGLKDYVPGEIRQPMFERLYNYHQRQDLEEASASQKRLLVAIDNEAGDKAIRDGDTKKAQTFYDRALEAAKTLSEKEKSNFQYRRDLGVGYEKLGGLQLMLGNTQQAREHYEKALKHRKDLRNSDPLDLQFARDLSVIYDKLGDLNLRVGDFSIAEKYYTDALLIRENLHEREPKDKNYIRDVSISHTKLGDLQLIRYGNEEKAQIYYSKSLAKRERLVSLDGNNTQFQRDLSVTYERFGDFYLRTGQPQEARHHYNKALAIRKNLADLDDTNTAFRIDLSVSYERLADMNYAFRKFDEAADMISNSISNWESLLSVDAQNSDLNRGIAVAFNKMGDIKLASGLTDEARKFFDKAFQINQRLIGLDRNNVQFLRDMSISYEKKGDLNMKLQDMVMARDFYQKALEQSKALAGIDRLNTQFQRDLAVSYAKLGNSYYVETKSVEEEEQQPPENEEAIDTEADPERTKNLEKARDHYNEFLSIFRGLQKNDALQADDLLFIEAFENRLTASLPTSASTDSTQTHKENISQ